MTVAVKTPVNKAAEPRFLEGTNDEAVLIIHGFTGYPGEFYELAEELNSRGYTVSLPLLPGHGRSREDFIRTDWRDWLNHARSAYRDLEEKYRAVSIVGLSMGGVLTLLLAAESSPARIALLAPAMAIRSPLFPLTPVLKYFIRETPKDWIPGENDSEEVKNLGREYWSRNYVKQIAGLHRLTRMARKKMRIIGSSALIMLSEIDKTVPLKAGAIIEKKLVRSRTRKIILSNSPHVLVSGPEKEYVKKQVINWISKGEINEE